MENSLSNETEDPDLMYVFDLMFNQNSIQFLHSMPCEPQPFSLHLLTPGGSKE